MFFCNFTSPFEIFMEKKLFYHVLAFNVNACVIWNFSPTMISDHVVAIGPFVQDSFKTWRWSQFIGK